MGLDCSHNCWHGAYSAFNRWRHGLAKAAGIPLDLMDGYFDGAGDRLLEEAFEWARARDGGPRCGSHYGPVLARFVEKVAGELPIAWDALKPDVLYVLLDHSDCDGEIAAEHCGPLADRLAELLPLVESNEGWGHIKDWRDKTQAFIDGLRLAAARGEAVGFH